MSSLATTLCFSLDRSPEAVQAGALVNSGRNSGGRSFPLSSPMLDVLGGVGCSSPRSLSWVSQTSDDLPGTSWQGQRIWFQKHGLSHLMGKTSRGGMPGHPGCLRLRLRMVIHTCAQRFFQTQVDQGTLSALLATSGPCNIFCYLVTVPRSYCSE